MFKSKRLVLKDYIKLKYGVIVEVSTVSLGIEHEWNGEKGYLYETILFFSKEKDSLVELPNSEVVTRYRTEKEAIEGHKKIVKLLREGKGYKFIKIPKLIIEWNKIEKSIC